MLARNKVIKTKTVGIIQNMGLSCLSIEVLIVECVINIKRLLHKRLANNPFLECAFFSFSDIFFLVKLNCSGYLALKINAIHNIVKKDGANQILPLELYLSGFPEKSK